MHTIILTPLRLGRYRLWNNRHSFYFKNFSMNKQQRHNFEGAIIIVIVFLLTAYLQNI